MSTLREPRARLRLGHADRADLGLGKDRGRHVGVVDRDRLAAEYGVGEGVPLADRHRSEVDPVGDVADRVDVRHAGLRELVDRDAAVPRERDAGRLEPEARDVRPPSGGEHHAVDREGLVVGQLDAVAVLDLRDEVDRRLVMILMPRRSISERRCSRTSSSNPRRMLSPR